MDQEKIPDRNAMDAQVQDFLDNDKLLLPIPKAFVPRPLNMQCTSSLVETPDVLGLCVVAQPVACTNKSPVVPTISNCPLHSTRHGHTSLHRYFCDLSSAQPLLT
jgi:hypothetical protein